MLMPYQTRPALHTTKKSPGFCITCGKIATTEALFKLDTREIEVCPPIRIAASIPELSICLQKKAVLDSLNRLSLRFKGLRGQSP